MKQLSSGQHFGTNKRTLKFNGTIVTEAGYFPGIEVPWHYHQNAYFFFHLKGRLDEVNKKKTITCTPGTLLFHHWEEPHYDKNFSSDASFFHIELENKWFAHHDIKPSTIEGSLELISPSLTSLFRQAYHEFRLNDQVTHLAIDGLLLQGMAEMSRVRSVEKSKSPAWVKRVKEILNDITDNRITLAFLAEHAGLHPVYLSKEFPRYFNESFGNYVRSIRLNKAAQRLMHSSDSISQIAYQFGFSDESHFIRCFKAKYSLTPSTFRKSFTKG
jgi:AraC family transcriptional regulator